MWWENWKYYGEAPARGILGGGVVQMAAMPLMCALLYLILADQPAVAARRARAVAPAISLPLVFAATTWPLYFSNHGELPAAVDWFAAAVAVTLALAAVPVITRLAERWRAAPAAALGDPLGQSALPRRGRAAAPQPTASR